MRDTKWAVYTKKAEFAEIARNFGIDQVTARIIRNRDIIGDDQIETYLHGSLEQMHDPSLLRGVNQAAAILLEKITEENLHYPQ